MSEPARDEGRAARERLDPARPGGILPPSAPSASLVPEPAPAVDVSVLVPAKDEAENLPLFMEQARAAFAADAGVRYEVVVVDDGSIDETWAVLQRLEARYSFLRSTRHRARRGIADALRTGYLHSRGRVLVFYPADLQFKPEDIPRLVAPILADECDLVTGYKQGRRYEKAFVSSVYNRLSRRLFHIPVRDLNSVKAYRREVMESLPVRSDWHRYMVVIAAAEGFKVSEISVPLYPRHAGRSKFGLSGIPIGVLDMLAVWFELRFGKKPLLLFGMVGAALFALGVLMGLVALAWLLAFGVGVRAVWTLVQTSLILGGVVAVGGFIGELIAGQRAEVRELRRLIDEMRAERDGLRRD